MTDYLDQLVEAGARRLIGGDPCYSETEQAQAVLTAAFSAVLTDPCATCSGDLVALQFGATMPGDESTCRDCQDEDGNPTGRVPASVRLMLGEQEGWTIEGAEPVYRAISPEDTP